MKRLVQSIMIAICSVALSSKVTAQQEEWYGGIAAGMGIVDISTNEWDDGTLTNKHLKNKSFSYKVTAGYHFTSHFAGELSYLHFGDSKFTAYEPGTIPSIWLTGDVKGTAKESGVSVTGMLSQSLSNRFSVFASGGAFFWNTTLISDPTLSGGTLALSERHVVYDDGIRFIYGVGADMRVYRQLHMRLEWEHTTVRFAGYIDRGIDFPSLGMTLNF
jgi:OmpA-like transmembrane domain